VNTPNSSHERISSGFNISRVWATIAGDAIPTERQLPVAKYGQKSGKRIFTTDR
jgi:hypothetical protein